MFASGSQVREIMGLNPAGPEVIFASNPMPYCLQLSEMIKAGQFYQIRQIFIWESGDIYFKG